MYRSKVINEESETPASIEVFDAARTAINRLDDTVMEVMASVDSINYDLSNHYYKLGYDERHRNEQQPTPHLVLTYTSYAYSVSFDGWQVWGSEDEGEMYDDDDNPLPFEPYFRKQIEQRLATLKDMPKLTSIIKECE